MRSELFNRLLSFDDAKRLVLDAAIPVERVDHVSLPEAAGRAVAREYTAAVDVPPFDRAAMDGYAVIASDTVGASPESPRRLRVAGTIFAGGTSGQSVRPGECVAIATGAPLPPGADAVVMVEATTRQADSIAFSHVASQGQNVGRRGSDMTCGDVVVQPYTLLTPARLGALAATGMATVTVVDRPRVAIASTGNELKPPGTPLASGEIYNVNRFTLDAIVRRHGGIAVHVPTVPDSLDHLSDALDAAQAQDLAVFSGGSSVGDRDLLIDAMTKRGTVIFHGIAIRPGKPTLFGRVGRTLVLGLSGYPTSCLSNAYLLLVPLLRKLGRLPAWRPETITVPLARTIVSPAGRHQFYTVTIVDGAAQPAFKTSGSITSMANADGYIEIPAGVDVVDAGTTVVVTLFGD